MTYRQFLNKGAKAPFFRLMTSRKVDLMSQKAHCTSVCMSKRRSIALFLVAVIMLCFPCSAAHAAPLTKYNHSFFGSFDTVITLTGFAASEAHFKKSAVFAESAFGSLHQLFDKYHPYGDMTNLFVVNQHAGKQAVSTPPVLYQLLRYALREQGSLNSTVNIAMGSVLTLWHEARDDADYDAKTAELPSQEALAQAATHTHVEDLELVNNTQSVRFLDDRMSVDVGAVAKGYAAELVGTWLDMMGMPHYVLNAGGNVKMGAPPLDGRSHWGVSIQNPFGNVLDSGDILDVIFAQNMSAVTSGDYQRYFVKDGKRYHHIISPKTLLPSDFFRAVTVLTEDSAQADLLSTALFLMPQQDGEAFLRTLPQVEALWVMNDRSIVTTAGMDQYLKSKGAINSP